MAVAKTDKAAASLGEMIRRSRVQKGLTQRALASAVGTYQDRINKWETNKSTPGFERLKKLAEFFGWSDAYASHAYVIADKQFRENHKYNKEA